VTVEQLTIDGNDGNGIYIYGSSVLKYRNWMGPFSVTNNGAGGIWIAQNSSADLGGATVTGNRIGHGGMGSGVAIAGNSTASFWAGGSFTGNDPVDISCNVNAFAAGMARATIGITYCVDPFQQWHSQSDCGCDEGISKRRASSR